MQLLGKLMGDPNKRDLKAIQPLIDKINSLEPAMQKLSDEALAAKTAEFRSQLYLHLKGGLVLEEELVKEIEPAIKEIDDDELHEAFDKAWPRFEEARRNTADKEEGADERLEQLLGEILQQLQPEIVALKAEAMDQRVPEMAKRYRT